MHKVCKICLIGKILYKYNTAVYHAVLHNILFLRVVPMWKKGVSPLLLRTPAGAESAGKEFVKKES